jgi:hypothetical protein
MESSVQRKIQQIVSGDLTETLATYLHLSLV